MDESRVAAYARAVAIVAGATAVCWLMFPVAELTDLVLVYLLGTVLIAASDGRGPSVFASLASVAAFDFFFVPPYLAFDVAHPRYLLTFAVMLIVALVISGLTVRIRRQAEAAEQRERRTAALYAMSRELAQGATVDDLIAIAARHLGEVFTADVTIFLPAAGDRLEPRRRGASTISDNELALAHAAFELRQATGLGTRTSPGAAATYLPLLGHRGVLGVVGIEPPGRRALEAPEPFRLLETLVNQTALALERARLAEEAQQARVGAETERLRNSLLTSVSHDLRTPLAAITGAATTMLEGGGRLDAGTRQELLEAIRDEAERLNRLVQNLLEMTRLESGALTLRRDWHPVEEVVGAALGRAAKRLASRRVTVTIPPDLPLVAIDDVLIEQVLVNLLDNAVKYAAPEGAIRLMATATAHAVTVEVANHGPTLPPGEEERVFEKFHRVVADGRQGAGLGLAICRGIVEAHGGRIWAQNLPEGGVAFLFTLPLAEASLAPLPADA